MRDHRLVVHVARRAFSLIELLVVISIMVILIGLVMILLSKARESAYVATCSSNLKQMGVAVASYVHNDGKFLGLAVFELNGNIRDHNDNEELLYEYINDLNVFTCPSTTNFLEAGDEYKLAQSPNANNGRGTSYEAYGAFDVDEMNNSAYGDQASQWRALKSAISIKAYESQVFLIFDQDNPGVNHDLSLADNHGPLGGNILFADTHVALVKGSDWEPTRYRAQRLNRQ